MNIYELYFTIIAIVIFIRGLGRFIFPRISHFDCIPTDRKAPFVQLFGSVHKYTWVSFWLSALWLVLWVLKLFETDLKRLFI